MGSTKTQGSAIGKEYGDARCLTYVLCHVLLSSLHVTGPHAIVGGPLHSHPREQTGPGPRIDRWGVPPRQARGYTRFGTETVPPGTDPLATPDHPPQHGKACFSHRQRSERSAMDGT
jgi:hypothetical protein